MARKSLILILLVLSLGCINYIAPGVGYGKYRLNISKLQDIINEEDTREEFSKNGIYFSFEQGQLLTSITFVSSEYFTKEELRVGSSRQQVLDLKGEPESSDIIENEGDILKSLSTGKLVYPGIIFYLKKDEVIAIFVVPFDQ